MKKIVFVCYGGGHVKMLIPIIKIMLANAAYDITVIGLTTAGSILKANNIPYLSYKDFINLYRDDRWEEFGKNLCGIVPASSLVSYEESIAYHGINYVELIDTYGLQDAEHMYAQNGRQCFYPVNFFKVLFSHLQPDLVVATNSPRSERASIVAAGLLGIRSVCLVDMFALQEVKWIANNDFANKVCVLNESVKSMFIEKGRNEADIMVTGNPAFDSLFDPSVIQLSKVIRDTHKIEPSRKIILYASQPEPEKHPFNDLRGNPCLPMDIENCLRDFVKTTNEFHLIIRYHPSENTLFNPQSNVSLSEKGENLHELIHAIDIVVVTASTVGLEAHLVGKQVISVDKSIFTTDAPFSVMGVSSGVSDEAMLPQKIKSAFSVSKPTAIKKSDFPLASSKVISVIDDSLIA